MAKKRAAATTASAEVPVSELKPGTYFKRILKSNPKLLEERDNETIYKRWLKDHPGHEDVPPNIKQNLANIKSTMRKAREERMARRATKAPKAAPSAHAPVASPRVRSAPQELERLEAKLDDCLL